MASALFSERYAAVVQALTSARKRADVTQVELAARLGKPQSFVSKIERQERRIDPVELYDWACALGISPTVLFEAAISRMRATHPS